MSLSSLSWQRYEIPQSRGRYLNSPQFRVSTCLWFLWGGLTFAVDLPDLFFLRPGRSSLFPIDDNLLDDGHGNQGVPGVLGSPNCYPHQNGERIERFSRKVFVGGLPPDIDEGEDNITVFQGWIILLTFAFRLSTIFLSLLPSIVSFSLTTDEITSSFRRFGHLVVDWPHKAESKSYFPPKGIVKIY